MAEDNPISTDYEIGYGKPPKATRFGPGNNANPKGRPKRTKGGDSIIFNILEEIVVVHENGKRRRLSAEEVIHRRQRNLAMKGDPKAAKFLMDLKRRSKRPEIPPALHNLSSLSDEELHQLEHLRLKLSGAASAKGNERK